MSRSKTQFERFADIDRRIRNGEYPSIKVLAQRWEVSERSIKRDLEFLRDRNSAPLAYDSKRRGYFYTEKSWVFPAVSLGEAELFSLLIARQALEQYKGLPVAKKLKKVYQRIAETLTEELEINADDIVGEFTFVTPPSIPVDPAVWETICGCVIKNKKVKITYLSRSSSNPKQHEISPYHIANIHGDWYVFVKTQRGDNILQFAMGRIQSAVELDDIFIRSKSFNPKNLMEHTFGRFASMECLEDVCIRISKDWALEIETRQWHPKQTVKKLTCGSVELNFPVSAGGARPYFHVIEWVLSMGRHAQVIAPKQLKMLVAEEIEAMTKST